MLDLGKTHMSIDLKYFVKNFVPKERAYKILKNKDDKVEKESIFIWNKAFGLLVPSEEEEEEEARDVVELESSTYLIASSVENFSKNLCSNLFSNHLIILPLISISSLCTL